MARRCNANINLSAIKKNYLYAKSLAPKAKAIAIVKANAYGHGAIEVASHLESCADYFGVACTEEAIDLRRSGLTKTPILLLEGLFEASEIDLVVSYNLTVAVCNPVQLDWVLSTSLKQRINVFIKHDSGMGRLGFQDKEFKVALKLLEDSDNVRSVTMMTHFSSAEEPENDATSRQVKSFHEAVGKNNSPQSLANSAGIIAVKSSHADYIRPGIMLYGSSPFKDKSYSDKLLSAMTLSSPLISIKSFKEGQTIGYGERFTCKKDMVIGVVAIGYGDGYPRSAKDGTPVFINGDRSSLAGKVSMDMITIDLSNINDPQIGDQVELFGDNVSIDEVAEYCDTISYEIFTQITSRVYKTYDQ